MNIRDFLNQHFEINNAINSKLEQISELRRLGASAASPMFSESRSIGTHSDRVGRTAAKIADLENEINDEIDRLVDLKCQIREVVAAVPDSTQRTILERHYLLGESWEVIAEKVGYSTRHITRLHNQAIERLDRIFPEPMAG